MTETESKESLKLKMKNRYIREKAIVNNIIKIILNFIYFNVKKFETLLNKFAFISSILFFFN